MQIYNATEAGYWTGAIHVTLRYERIRTQAQYGRIVVVSSGLAQLTECPTECPNTNVRYLVLCKPMFYFKVIHIYTHIYTVKAAYFDSHVHR